MEDKKKIPFAKELTDELLEKVSGGTGVDEEEEELPGYDDVNDALAALYAGKKCITCDGCGLLLCIEGQGIVTCPRCGRQH